MIINRDYGAKLLREGKAVDPSIIDYNGRKWVAIRRLQPERYDHYLATRCDIERYIDSPLSINLNRLTTEMKKTVRRAEQH